VNKPVRVALFAAIPHYIHAPLYRALAADSRLDFTAIFASDAGIRPFDLGYGDAIAWDVDALSGYRSIFLRNARTNPTAGGGVLALRDFDIVSTLARGRYDVLWLFGYHTVTHVLAAFTQKIMRRTLLFREEQTTLHVHARPLWKRVLKAVGIRILLSGSGALYIGTNNRKWFEYYGVPEERLFFTPYAVDNDHFQAAAREFRPRREELRRSFGIAPAGGPVILTVSRLMPKKQPMMLIEAFRRVRAERQCTLLVVGSGPLESEMRAAVTDGAVPDVVFAGFCKQSEIVKAYGAADVFALASGWDETWGLVVNEAMNFSLPITVSDKVGSAIDLVRQGENGFVFPSTDTEALTNSLDRLVGDEDLRRRMGTRSRSLIEAWTYERAAQGIIEAISNLRAGSP
jgi:glycosyltransferase involved in cell wall biosynthesis